MDYAKEFTSHFEILSRRHGRQRVFSDFVEIAACTVHQAPYHTAILEKDEVFAFVERCYLEAIKRYDRTESDSIIALYSIAVMALVESHQDFLGQMYMNLEISNAKNGEFFTPPCMARLMAMMSLPDVSSAIKDKGYITVNDPASGGGVMLIEVANELHRLGFDPRKTMWFEATDINRTCFNLTYFQLSVLGISGAVIHGNTLSMVRWEIRETPTWKILQSRMERSSTAVTPEPENLSASSQSLERPFQKLPRLLTQVGFDF